MSDEKRGTGEWGEGNPDPSPSAPTPTPIDLSEPEQPPRGRKRSLITLAAVGVLLAVIALVVWLSNRPSAIESAAEACTQTLSVADEGKTIRLHVLGEDSSNIDVFTVASLDNAICILDELEAPTAVRDHISQTRALDGQQTDEWGSFSARWTYHPDEGLQMTIQEN